MKINLASGQRPFSKPWVNIDLIEQNDSQGNPYALDIKADAKSLPMIKDESVDIIVAHHLFEHIFLNDIDATITEWRRILKPGGILAIYVPNLKEIDKAWIEGKIPTFIHNVNTYGAYQGHMEDTHKWGYDFDELRDRVCGWDGNNSKYKWESIGSPDYNDPRYQGADIAKDWWILEVQFVK